MPVCPNCQTRITQQQKRSGQCPNCSRGKKDRQKHEANAHSHGTLLPNRQIANDADACDEAVKSNVASEQSVTSRDDGTLLHDFETVKKPDTPEQSKPANIDTASNSNRSTAASPDPSADGDQDAIDTATVLMATTDFSNDFNSRSILSTVRSKDPVSLVANNTVVRPMQVSDIGEQSEFDDYQLLKKIGKGGMGVVFRARQRSINRDVAVKQIRPDAATDENRMKFLAEAAVTGELAHPNIVPVHDLGQREDGTLFYSMKEVTGDSWLDVMHASHRNASKTPKTQDENVEILLRVTDAVAFAHSRGYVHRDLKPENIMLGSFGEVLLMDWGLAGRVSEPKKLTAGGTPAYMAPEMAQGYLYQCKLSNDPPFASIGFHSDIYLLGAILFEIESGRPPHASSDQGAPHSQTIECVQHAARNEIISKGNRDDGLQIIARKAMATDPSDRYATVVEFQTAIKEHQERAQSIRLADRAAIDLDSANETDLELLARAQHGFEGALALWSNNDSAIIGLEQAKNSFAKQKKRNSIKTGAISFLLALIFFGTLVFSWKLILANKKAKEGWESALIETKRAEKEKQAAEESKKIAEEAQSIAEKKEGEAKLAKADAELQKEKAESARIVAVNNEEEAKRQKRIAEERETAAKYGRFVAGIALVDARLTFENDLSRARKLLEDIHDDFLSKQDSNAAQDGENSDALFDWEMYHLFHRCHPEIQAIESDGRDHLISTLSAKGEFASAAKDRLQGKTFIRKWLIGKPTRKISEVEIPSLGQVFDVRLSPDGRFALLGLTLNSFEVRSRSNNFLLVDFQQSKVADQKFINAGKLKTMSVAPAGRWIVTGGMQAESPDIGGVAVWEIQNGKLNLVDGLLADGHSTSLIDQIQFVPDGSKVLEINQDKKWFLREFGPGGPQKPRELAHPSGNFNRATCLAVRDSQLFVYAQSSKLFAAELASNGLIKHIDPLAQQPHLLNVLCIAFNADRTRMATSSDDRTIVVWDARNLKKLKTLRGHTQPVTACAYLIEGGQDILYSSSEDGAIRRWEPENYVDDVSVPLVNGRIATISKDGQYIATGTSDGQLEVWTKLGDRVAVSRVGHKPVARISAFFANNRIVTVGTDAAICWWNLKNGIPEKMMTDAPISDPGRNVIAVSPDGTKVVRQAIIDKDVLRYDTFENGKLISTIDEKFVKIVQGFAIGNDGKIYLGIATGDIKIAGGPWFSQQSQNAIDETANADKLYMAVRRQDGALIAVTKKSIRVWNQAGKLLKREPIGSKSQFFVSGELSNGMLMLRFRSDASGFSLQFWDTNAMHWIPMSKPLSTKLGDNGFNPIDAALSNDGESLFVLTASRELWKASIKDDACERHSLTAVIAKTRAERVFCLDDDRICTYATSGDVRIWQLHDEEEPEIVRCDSSRGFRQVDFVNTGAGESRRVVTLSFDGVVRIWEFAHKNDQHQLSMVHAFQKHAGQDYFKSCIGPDGNKAVLLAEQGANSSEVVLLDLSKADKISRQVVNATVRSMAWSKDKLCLATSDRRILQANLESPNKVRLRELSIDLKADVLLISLTPNGDRMAIASNDNSVQIFEAIDNSGWNNSPIEIKIAASRFATSIEFAPSGKRLFIGEDGGAVGIWQADRPSENELISLRGHMQPINSIRFANDGQMISSDKDKLIVRFVRPFTDSR